MPQYSPHMETAEIIARLPRKPRYCISDFAAVLGTTEQAARRKLYYALSDGKLEYREHLGSIRIPRHEVLRILEGEIPL